MAIVRRHYSFGGRVQGVGFRYTAQYIAQGLGLSGWVRNEWDDRDAFAKRKRISCTVRR